jgi:hypothetical protein
MSGDCASPNHRTVRKLLEKIVFAVHAR